MKNPIFPETHTIGKTSKSLRGDNYEGDAWRIRPAFRNREDPWESDDDIGFRIFRTKEKS